MGGCPRACGLAAAGLLGWVAHCGMVVLEQWPQAVALHARPLLAR
jgi:hypothetical protein